MLLPVDPLLTVRLFGLRLTTHTSSLIVLAVVVAGALTQQDAAFAARASTAGWILTGIATAAVVLAAFVLREAARLWVCRQRGVAVRRIHLYVFGGAAETVDSTTSPRAETMVGLAGLLALLGVAGLVALAHLLTRRMDGYLHLSLRALLIACIGLTVLQAMPGPPLDGGRILRAWLWYLTDDLSIGTRAAALYAQVIAAGMMVLGITLLVLDHELPFWGLWIAVAGWHLSGAARVHVRRSEWQRLSTALLLRDALPLNERRIRVGATVEEIVDLLIEVGHDAPYLVIGADGKPVGVVRIANLRHLRRAAWDRHIVEEVMTPLASLPRLSGALSVFDAIGVLDDARQSLAIVEDNGEISSVLTRAQIVGRLYDRGRRASP